LKIISDKTIIDPSAVIGECGAIHAFVTVYWNVIIDNDVQVFENCVIGKPPTPSKAMSRKVLPGDVTLIKARTILCPGVVVYSGTRIGQDCLLADHACVRENCRIEDGVILGRHVTVNYDTTIGYDTKVMDGTHLTGGMVIEDHVFISVGVNTANENSMDRDEDFKLAGPIVRRGARIGAGAILLPGVEIGENAVVGAGAVVTHNVPPRVVVMGAPARIVRDVPKEQWR
jgi:acetyltransferase-like isoleucine patch superfamily enzyme